MKFYACIALTHKYLVNNVNQLTTAASISAVEPLLFDKDNCLNQQRNKDILNEEHVRPFATFKSVNDFTTFFRFS